MEKQKTIFAFTEHTSIESTPEPNKEPSIIATSEPSEQDKIMDLLGRYTAQMLLEGMREVHPRPEWGDTDDENKSVDCCNTWRSYYIAECRRRGLRLLEQLCWNTEEDSLYVNIHIGSVESLIDITTQSNYYDNSIADQVWVIIEHWEPYDPAKPNIYRINYVKDNIEILNRCLLNKEITKAEIKSHKHSLKLYHAELLQLESIGAGDA